ncbi:hypothetical protein MferCBS31731_000849 [Microsporum ferrugineum]
MEDDSFVDLTAPSPNTAPASGVRPVSPILRTWSSHAHQPSSFGQPRERAKRRRLDNNDDSGSIAGPSSRNEPMAQSGIPDEIEAVDLTEVDDSSSLARILAKQREDAILAQKKTSDQGRRSTLTAYKCPVCMDVLENATTTICGHLFCHKCIIDTLKYNEARRALEGAGKGARGSCPVCRKSISRADTPGPRRNLVPLQFKLTTRKKS